MSQCPIVERTLAIYVSAMYFKMRAHDLLAQPIASCPIVASMGQFGSMIQGPWFIPPTWLGELCLRILRAIPLTWTLYRRSAWMSHWSPQSTGQNPNEKQQDIAQSRSFATPHAQVNLVEHAGLEGRCYRTAASKSFTSDTARVGVVSKVRLSEPLKPVNATS